MKRDHAESIPDNACACGEHKIYDNFFFVLLYWIVFPICKNACFFLLASHFKSLRTIIIIAIIYWILIMTPGIEICAFEYNISLSPSRWPDFYFFINVLIQMAPKNYYFTILYRLSLLSAHVVRASSALPRTSEMSPPNWTPQFQTTFLPSISPLQRQRPEKLSFYNFSRMAETRIILYKAQIFNSPQLTFGWHSKPWQCFFLSAMAPLLLLLAFFCNPPLPTNQTHSPKLSLHLCLYSLSAQSLPEHLAGSRHCSHAPLFSCTLNTLCFSPPWWWAHGGQTLFFFYNTSPQPLVS